MSNANKALIITILLSSTVVLMAFNLHVLKNNKLMAETYYDLLSEDELVEEVEELEDILKSLDKVMATNKAFNETKNPEDFEDEEFKSTMDKIRNRDTRVDDLDETTNSSSDPSKSNTEELSSFDNINDIIATRSEKKRASSSTEDSDNKNSSVTYSLVDRSANYLPPPIYLCERGGKIVVNITVDKNGNVIEASYNSASSSSNGCLVDHALEYAKASKFNAAPKTQQIGTITFYFKGKS